MEELLKNPGVIALIGALLGAPFLTFIVSLVKAKAEKNNVIVTGANTTVTAMQTALTSLRQELEEVREDLTDSETRRDAEMKRHRDELTRLKEEHASEMAARDTKIQLLEQAVAEMRGLYDNALRENFAERADHED